jgi:hypothetical protein
MLVVTYQILAFTSNVVARWNKIKIVSTQWTKILPNDVAEWLTLLLRIRQVPVPISVQKPANLNAIFREFPQSLHENAGLTP